MRHLSSRSNVKRSLRNDKSYLLHPPCTKTNRHGQDVLVKQQSFIIIIRNHLHTSHRPFIPRYGWSSHSQEEIPYKHATQHGNSLRSMYNMTLFRYCQHHGITHRVAGILPNVVKIMGRRLWIPFRDTVVRLAKLF